MLQPRVIERGRELKIVTPRGPARRVLLLRRQSPLKGLQDRRVRDAPEEGRAGADDAQLQREPEIGLRLRGDAEIAEQHGASRRRSALDRSRLRDFDCGPRMQLPRGVDCELARVVGDVDVARNRGRHGGLALVASRS